MSDYEKIEMHLGDIRHEMTRENSHLSTYLGNTGVNLAMYNYIYTVMDIGSEKQGYYMFAHTEGFNDVAVHMLQNKYPGVINQPEVSDYDVHAFNRDIQNDVASDTEMGVPEHWQ